MPTTLPSYFGDVINGAAFTAAARTPDPARMLRGYSQAAITLNLLRAFTQGGFADLHRVQQWNQDFVAASPQGERYAGLAAAHRGIARLHDRLRHRSRAHAATAQHGDLHRA